MQRNTTSLTDGEFDVLVIGSGAFGAAAARDCVCRGLRTALIERNDFGGGTSAECFRMVHGGIRYLQHADLRRLRASCQERSTLLRIAPHLVSPLPIAIPTYGRGRRGRIFLGAGACAYDLLTFDRNRRIADPQRQIRHTQFLSREELLAQFPHLAAPDLSGAVVFEDGQMYSPSRLVLAFVKAAAAAGAAACNYVEALHFIWEGAAVRGVRASDRLSGEVFDIRAKLTLNAAGPWADELQLDAAHFGKSQRQPFSRDACFIVNRPPVSNYGLAIQGRSRDRDALFGRATRHLFAVPWRNQTLFGVWHRLFSQPADAAHVTGSEIENWIAELNASYPALELSADEVTYAHCGLVPFGDTATETELSFGKESRIVDHRAVHNVTGLVSLVGIRFTTACGDAARAVDMLLRQSPVRSTQRDALRPVRTASTAMQRLPGGDIDDFESFQSRALQARPANIGEPTLLNLTRNHGTEYQQVLQLAQDGSAARTVPGTATLLAEIQHAVHAEMATRLEDVVLRRTEMAVNGHPGNVALAVAAAEMARLCDWSPQRVANEIDRTQLALSWHLARCDSSVPASGPGTGSMERSRLAALAM